MSVAGLPSDLQDLAPVRGFSWASRSAAMTSPRTHASKCAQNPAEAFRDSWLTVGLLPVESYTMTGVPRAIRG
jgi:hypothetical protein